MSFLKDGSDCRQYGYVRRLFKHCALSGIYPALLMISSHSPVWIPKGVHPWQLCPKLLPRQRGSSPIITNPAQLRFCDGHGSQGRPHRLDRGSFSRVACVALPAGSLNRFQFLLGQIAVQPTEKYLGFRQRQNASRLAYLLGAHWRSRSGGPPGRKRPIPETGRLTPQKSPSRKFGVNGTRWDRSRVTPMCREIGWHRAERQSPRQIVHHWATYEE